MSASDFSGLEFSFEPVLGARAYDVRADGVLESPMRPHSWLPGENESECYYRPGYYPSAVRRHDMMACGCGFYAYNDGSNTYRGLGRVEGVVEGYGEVVIGTRGFRASKARIVALVLPDLNATTKRQWRWGYPAIRDRFLIRHHMDFWESRVIPGGWPSLVGILLLMTLVLTPVGAWLMVMSDRAFNIGLAVKYPSQHHDIHGERATALGLRAGKSSDLTPEQAGAIRARYPDAVTFNTFDEMVSVFTPTRAQGVTS